MLINRMTRFCLVAGLTFVVACGGTDLDDDSDRDGGDEHPPAVNDDAGYNDDAGGDDTGDGPDYSDYAYHFDSELKDYKYKYFDKTKDDDKDDKYDDGKDKKCKEYKCIEKKCVDEKCVDFNESKGVCKEYKCVETKCVEKECVKYYDDEDDKVCEKLKKKCYMVCKAKQKFWSKIDCVEYKYEKGDLGKKYYEICKQKKETWVGKDCKEFAKKCAKKKKDRDKIDPFPPDPVDNVCPLTHGYWKTHHEFENDYQQAQEVPWPGDYRGEELQELGDLGTLLGIMHTPPGGGDACYILGKQYVAAILNVEAGALIPEPDEIDNIDEIGAVEDIEVETFEDVLAAAEALLTNTDYCPGLTGQTDYQEQRDQALALEEILVAFNESEPDDCIHYEQTLNDND